MRAARAQASRRSSRSARSSSGSCSASLRRLSFIDHLPKLSKLGPIELGENSSVYVRNCTKKPCLDVPLGVIARAENRVSVRWKDIAPTMRSATVAIEDRRYWKHGALDWQGIARAALNNVRAGGITQGGSTLTQQLAKNLYLQREASSRSISRKIDEAWIAVQLQDKYTKAEILTAYLNTVFYGQNAYGVEAAAHTFFDKTSKQLTLPQSALLAGLPQAPTDYNPFLHPAAARQRRNEVLRAMRSLRWISADAYARAVRAPLGLRRGSYGTAVSSPFVFEQVRQELGAQAAAQARRARRLQGLLDSRPAAPVRGPAGDQGRALLARRSAGRPGRDQRAQRQRAGAGHLRLLLGQEPVQPRDGRAPLSRLDVQAVRPRDRAAPGADPTKVYYPSGYVSFPESDPVCPQAGGLVAAQRRKRLRRLPEPRDRDDPLRQRRLRAAHARPGAGAGGGHRASARHPLDAPAALLDGARRRRRDAARADERLRDDRGGRHLPPAARDQARPERRGQDRRRQRVPRALQARRQRGHRLRDDVDPQAASSRRARARTRASTTAVPRPARRARRRTTATPGSAATRPTSPPASGSAIAGRTSRSSASKAWAPSSAARCRRRSGRTS